MGLSSHILMVLLCFGQLAQAYNVNLKAEEGAEEEKLNAYLLKTFGGSSVSINSYATERSFDGVFKKKHNIVFTVIKDGQGAAFHCAYYPDKAGMIATIRDCKLPTVKHEGMFPNYGKNKVYTYDYMDETLERTDVDGRFKTLKKRIGFSSYTCNAKVPTFNFGGIGEKMSLVAAKDSKGFVLYSVRTGKGASRFASGDGETLELFASDGSSREVSFASFKKTVDEMKGVQQRALGAGIYYREDLRRMSDLLKKCCEEEADCPSEPAGLGQTLSVQDIGVSR